MQEQHRRPSPAHPAGQRPRSERLPSHRGPVVARWHEPVREHDVALGAFQDHARGHLAQLVQRERDRRQVDQARRPRVVDPGDRDLARHVDAAAPQTGQQPDRHLVVDAEHGVGERAAEQRLGGRRAGLELETAGQHDRLGAGRIHGRPEAVEPVRARVQARPAPRRTRSAGVPATAGARSPRAPPPGCRPARSGSRGRAPRAPPRPRRPPGARRPRLAAPPPRRRARSRCPRTRRRPRGSRAARRGGRARRPGGGRRCRPSSGGRRAPPRPPPRARSRRSTGRRCRRRSRRQSGSCASRAPARARSAGSPARLPRPARGCASPPRPGATSRSARARRWRSRRPRGGRCRLATPGRAP